jgi:hypothetical protein
MGKNGGWTYLLSNPSQFIPYNQGWFFISSEPEGPDPILLSGIF